MDEKCKISPYKIYETINFAEARQSVTVIDSNQENPVLDQQDIEILKDFHGYSKCSIDVLFNSVVNFFKNKDLIKSSSDKKIEFKNDEFYLEKLNFLIELNPTELSSYDPNQLEGTLRQILLFSKDPIYSHLYQLLFERNRERFLKDYPLLKDQPPLTKENFKDLAEKFDLEKIFKLLKSGDQAFNLVDFEQYDLLIKILQQGKEEKNKATIISFLVGESKKFLQNRPRIKTIQLSDAITISLKEFLTRVEATPKLFDLEKGISYLSTLSQENVDVRTLLKNTTSPLSEEEKLFFQYLYTSKKSAPPPELQFVFIDKIESSAKVKKAYHEAWDFIKKELGIDFREDVKVTIKNMPGHTSEHRSSAYPQWNYLIIDTEDKVENDSRLKALFIHEITHLILKEVPDYSSLYSFIHEGLATWVENLYLRSVGIDRSYNAEGIVFDQNFARSKNESETLNEMKHYHLAYEIFKEMEEKEGKKSVFKLINEIYKLDYFNFKPLSDILNKKLEAAAEKIALPEFEMESGAHYPMGFIFSGLIPLAMSAGQLIHHLKINYSIDLSDPLIDDTHTFGLGYRLTTPTYLNPSKIFRLFSFYIGADLDGRAYPDSFDGIASFEVGARLFQLHLGATNLNFGAYGSIDTPSFQEERSMEWRIGSFISVVFE